MKLSITVYLTASPRDDDIIHLVAKEGKLKVEARAFAVAIYDKRIHVGLLGQNMSAHVLPLFSSQTMTDSEITLTKKVSKLTRESATRKLSTTYQCRFGL